LHGAQLLHGEPSLHARDVLLPSYVRRVPLITSVKHHFVAPETLRQLYAGKNLHRVKISRKMEDFESNSFSPNRLTTPKPDRLTVT
jgi:hypothetical protein